jgi:outer membrane protein OmpA-like peptidoglycan-associated protein
MNFKIGKRMAQINDESEESNLPRWGAQRKQWVLGLALGGMVMTGAAPFSAAQVKAPPSQAEIESVQVERIPAGLKKKIAGVILRREVDSFVLRDKTAGEIRVLLTSKTRVEEKKSNIFRRGRNYGTTSLVRGLSLEVEGRGNDEGALVAEKIRFTDNAYVTAQSVETRVVPVEERVEETSTRLSQAEANAQRLSGQLAELDTLSKSARTEAGTAQRTANDALTRVETTNRRIDATNQRIDQLVSSLDDYEAKRVITIQFRVGSARLLAEATQALDEIAAQAQNERAYMIEIAGFASAEGGVALNRRLSQQRADAVVRYLAETHGVPLRRMITPFGYGAAQPVADNTSREGREQNRRVEVRILVNRALQPANPAPPRGAKAGSSSF